MKRLWVWAALAAALACLLPAYGDDAAHTPGLKFTLAEAEGYALRNHPRMAASQFTADAVRQQIREARSAFFPQIYGESTSVYAPYDNQTGEFQQAPPFGARSDRSE